MKVSFIETLPTLLQSWLLVLRRTPAVYRPCDKPAIIMCLPLFAQSNLPSSAPRAPKQLKFVRFIDIPLLPNWDHTSTDFQHGYSISIMMNKSGHVPTTMVTHHRCVPSSWNSAKGLSVCCFHAKIRTARDSQIRKTRDYCVIAVD